MLYKVGLSYKLLLVILGMSPNYVSGSNANERNVNSNGNADSNNNVITAMVPVQITTKIDKIYYAQNKWLNLFGVRSSFMKLGENNYLCL